MTKIFEKVKNKNLCINNFYDAQLHFGRGKFDSPFWDSSGYSVCNTVAADNIGHFALH